MVAGRAYEPRAVRADVHREEGVTSVTLQCRVTPETKRASDYVLVPFGVRPGTRRLELSYGYEGQERLGGNKIDLGLVDPRGVSFRRFEAFAAGVEPPA
jgi:hypothetical protein